MNTFPLKGRMRPGPMSALGLALGLVLALPAMAATAADTTDNTGALQRCRAVPEAAARLACYDALPLSLPARQSPAVAPDRGQATPAARPAAVAPAAAQNFGQEGRNEPEALSSHIPGSFEGWGPRSRITLANGQVWQVVDGSEGVYFLQNPKVTVRRALMGGFQLDIEGAKRTPRVRRVQ